MSILNFNNIEIAQILVSIFFSIVFFQSSLDKINDREGNLKFFNHHFKGTFFQNYTSLSLNFLALSEITSAFLCCFGRNEGYNLHSGSAILCSHFCFYAVLLAPYLRKFSFFTYIRFYYFFNQVVGHRGGYDQ